MISIVIVNFQSVRVRRFFVCTLGPLALLSSSCVCCHLQRNADDETVGTVRPTSRGIADGFPVLPVWGKLVVYDSPRDARKALTGEGAEYTYVRLIQLASNRQLKHIMLARKEVCGSNAAFYMRVADTYPASWLTWDTNKAKANVDLVCGIPQSGARDMLLDSVRGFGCVRLRVDRDPKSKRYSRELVVNPGSLVPGGPGFDGSGTDGDGGAGNEGGGGAGG